MLSASKLMLSAISKNVIVIQTHVISNQNDVISAGWSRPSLRPHCPPCKLLSFLHSSETYRILRWGSRNRKHDSPKVHGPASHPSILFPLQKIMVWLLPSWSCLTWTRLSPARSPGWPRSPTSAGRRTWSTSSGECTMMICHSTKSLSLWRDEIQKWMIFKYL